MISVGEAPRLFVKKGRIGMMIPNPRRSRNMVINATNKGLLDDGGMDWFYKRSCAQIAPYVTCNAIYNNFLY